MSIVFRVRHLPFLITFKKKIIKHLNKMKTSKFLLSTVAIAAAGFAFAIPNITKAPAEAPAKTPASTEVREYAYENLTDVFGDKVGHENNPMAQSYIGLTNADGEVVVLTADGKGEADYEKAALFNVYSNEAITEFQIKNTAGKYLQYKELTVAEEHEHVALETGGFCCGATAATPKSHKEYVLAFDAKKAGKNVTLTLNGDVYSVTWDGKQLSTTTYAGSEFTAPGAYENAFTFDATGGAEIGFVTKAQVDFIAAAKAAVEQYENASEEVKAANVYDDAIAIATNKTRVDFEALLEELNTAMAVAKVKADAYDYLTAEKYQGESWVAMKQYLKTVGGSDADAISEEIEKCKAEIEAAKAKFSVEMIKSAYNYQEFKVVVAAEDENNVDAYISGTAPKYFKDPILLTKTYEYKRIGLTRVKEKAVMTYAVTRNSLVNGEIDNPLKAIYNADFIVSVNASGNYPETASCPVKGYQQVIGWTVSNLFNVNYTLKDGLVFFGEGEQDLYFFTVGYNPAEWATKDPVAYIKKDKGGDDFAISQPEFVCNDESGEVSYWKVTVKYTPASKADNYPNYDACNVYVWVPTIDFKEPLDAFKSLPMRVEGMPFSFKASVEKIDFPWYGGEEEVVLSYENLSGHLLFNKIMVVSDNPLAYQAYFTDKYPSLTESAIAMDLSGKGTQNITIKAQPREKYGVTEGTIKVYGLYGALDQVKVLLAEIPVTTTHPDAQITSVVYKNGDAVKAATDCSIFEDAVPFELNTAKDSVKVTAVFEGLENIYTNYDIRIKTGFDYFKVSDITYHGNKVDFWVYYDPKVHVGGSVELDDVLTVNVYKSGDIKHFWEVEPIHLHGAAFTAEQHAKYYGNAAGIKVVNADEAFEGAMFNAAGQRVNKSAKGIVIINGKKYVK